MTTFHESGDEASSLALLREAGALLTQAKSNAPPDLATQLFGRVIAEDLLKYTAADLALLAQSAWDFLIQRAAGHPKIRLTFPDTRDGPLAAISVLEIINDDMPFLVDSVLAQLTECGAEVLLVAHPVFIVRRDGMHRLIEIGDSGSGDAARESVIHIHLARIDDEAQRAMIVGNLEGALADVRVAVADWRPMLARVNDAVAAFKANPPPMPVDEIAEAIQFLEWLIADNFTFLGVRDYRLNASGDALMPVPESGLGLLRAQQARVLRRGDEAAAVTPEVRSFLMSPRPLIVSKSAAMSRVHRHVHLDYVGLKQFDAKGKLCGEFRIVGLFTSTAYTRPTSTIPYLRRKIAYVVERAGFDPAGHLGKALASVLENYPRDELFQIDDETLYRFATLVMQLDGRPRVRVLPRRDGFGRFVSVIVYVPRDRYDSSARTAIGAYLAAAYRGRVSAYYPFFPEGPNVRVHFIIGCDAPPPDIARAELELAIENIVRSWSDAFSEALRSTHDADTARDLIERYRAAFSAGYRGVYNAATAVADVKIIETLTPDRPRGVAFYAPSDSNRDCVGLKIWSLGQPLALTQRVPILENMGFRVVDERTYEIGPMTSLGATVWFHDMMLERVDNGAVDVAALKLQLEACFLAVVGGVAENDGYNALVLGAALGWRDVALVRTLSRYLRQARVAFSQDYMWATLVKHSGIVRQLVALFYARFDPRVAEAVRADGERELLAAIEAALGAVESLDEDRILRRFVNAISAGVRTNYFQLDGDGRPRSAIAIKFASQQIDALPAPRPLYEIFVYSPRVEGIHLRFGTVARGGIRWSDRPQDFRTEILGLVKAQQVKNAVIVPVGAKGGFVPKQLPKGGSREAVMEEGIAAYRLFIQSLLDLTDNIVSGKLVPPIDTVRRDGDDPYLVVAADKGTATFSDIANELARAHGFWLDDAFASGGSAGYDHKKMGITARGAWESVKRHFRERNVDIGATPFTVVGVGDMSGDVFGNGLLREKTTRLIAAFDHRDIFIDPDPDPAASYAERARLFALPRSSWQDYDKAKISAGGGVYARSLKHITLTAAAQRALGVTAETMTPTDLIRAILKAPVDLLFFGGIGTYIRATAETDAAAGDRANDAVRIAAADLRCKIIGEGANLGMTQLGRIEAAHHQIRLNTDAIDNSAGVNTSDVEVNIKIALSAPVHDGRLARDQRDRLLAGMTSDVAHLVLRNNYQQTLALSLEQRRGMGDLGFQQRLMHVLEQSHGLDRSVEFLPDDMELGERRRRAQPLTRPELAVLLAYAKLMLYAELLNSSVPDDPYLGRELNRYFPAALAEQFPDALHGHRLRREIIATQLANSVINRGGPSVVVRIADQTGAAAADIVRAFAAVRDSYSMTALNTDIDALDNRVAGDVQLALYASVQDVLLDRLVWFLRHAKLAEGLAGVVTHYRDGIAAVDHLLPDILTDDIAMARDKRVSLWQEAGVPRETAWRIANLPILALAPDVILTATASAKPLGPVAATYFAVDAYFRISAITEAATAIPASDYFERLALDRALDSIAEAQRRICAAVVADGRAGPEAVKAWAAARSARTERIRSGVHEIAATGLTLAKLTVAASLLSDMVGA